MARRLLALALPQARFLCGPSYEFDDLDQDALNLRAASAQVALGLDYNKLVEDARRRNAKLFDELGLIEPTKRPERVRSMRNALTVAAVQGATAFVLVAALFTGCDDTSQRAVPTSATVGGSGSGQSPPVPIVAAPDKGGAIAEVVPRDVTYTVTVDQDRPGIKRSLEVRINKRVSKEVLTAIAKKLKSEERGSYARTFIFYLLPEMKSGSEAWASTHFNPDLEVRILGLTADQANALTQTQHVAGRDVIGSWLDETIGQSCRLSLYRADGKVRLETTYYDGSSHTTEVKQEDTPGGRAFTEIDEVSDRASNKFGDYYLLDSKGDLQIRDNDGLIRTARRIKSAKEPDPSPPEPQLTDVRKWTSQNGKFTTEAKYGGMVGETVILKKTDGTTAKLKLDQLSPADREWIEAARKARR